MDRFPSAKPFRQIPPGNPGPIAIQHRLDKQPVVPSGYPHMPFASGKEVLNPFPLIARKPYRRTVPRPSSEVILSIESLLVVFGDPLIEDTP